MLHILRLSYANVALELIDTHAHLDDEQFQHDLPAVIERAAAAGVDRIVTVATTARSSAVCIALAQRYPALGASVGIQPNHVVQAGPDDWDRVVTSAATDRVVAIGETGLDRHWNDTPFAQQEDYFARHLQLARRHNLPVIIHCREAEADVVRVLREDYDRYGPVRGVMHSFTGDAVTAESCIAMGLHISFAGILTYKNAHNLRAVAARIPSDRLLVETDSPYLAPVPVRGRRNEPAFLVHTAACLGSVCNIESTLLAEQLTRNASQLFGFVP